MEDELLSSPGEASPVEQPMQRGPKWVFFGSDGLRAGWSALLFLLMAVSLILALGTAARFLFPPHPGQGATPRGAFIGEFIAAVSVLVATGIMVRIERRRIAAYGYAGRARLARFLWGALCGFVALSGLVVTLWQVHLLAFNPGHLHGIAALKYALAWMAAFFLTAIFEESLFRGYLLSTLTRGLGFWWGALILSVLFGAVHSGNGGESPVGVVAAGMVGLVLCISIWYTGSLWWAIGFHTAWDWAETYFYGTPDSGMIARGSFMSEHPTGPLLWSGGPTGPEGSLYIVPLLLIMALAMWLWWRGRGVTAPYSQDV
jgi:membrane protease YdiL (CAAX protease family)